MRHVILQSQHRCLCMSANSLLLPPPFPTAQHSREQLLDLEPKDFAERHAVPRWLHIRSTITVFLFFYLQLAPETDCSRIAYFSNVHKEVEAVFRHVFVWGSAFFKIWKLWVYLPARLYFWLAELPTHRSVLALRREEGGVCTSQAKRPNLEPLLPNLILW
jgi:hypothetical protein